MSSGSRLRAAWSLFVFALLVPCSCGLLSTEPQVYVAGYYQYGKGSQMVACYWRGERRTDLTSIEGYAHARDVFVAGGVVYTAGSTTGGACYWVGTEQFDLMGQEATSIVVSEGVVYTSGYSWEDSRNVACYWVGTERTDLPGGEAGAQATSIYVSGGTVYTAGAYSDVPGSQAPCYWVNTERVDLPYRPDNEQVGYEGRVYDMTVSDGVVYTAGWYQLGGRGRPCYWRGLDRVDLVEPLITGETTADSIWGIARSIYVSDGVVYTCGGLEGYSPLGTFICYWAGTTTVPLPGVPGHANSICVVEDKVYVAGYTTDLEFRPCLWVGTDRTGLDRSGDYDAQATSVFVVTR